MWRAFELSHQLGAPLGTGVTNATEEVGAGVQFSQRHFAANSVPKRVHFANEVELLLGDEDALDMLRLCMPSQTLQNWPEKPWTIKSESGLPDEPLSEVAVSISAVPEVSQTNDPFSQDHLQDLLLPQFEAPVPEWNGEEDDGYSPSEYDPNVHERHTSDDEVSTESDEPEEPDPGPVERHHPAQVEDLQHVMVYRLQHVPQHLLVDWGSYERLVLHLAELVHLNRHDVVAVHSLVVVPIGQPIHSEGVILQHVDDIPLGQPDQLILVDIKTFASVWEVGSERPPTVDRQVCRAQPILARTQFLELVRVGRYCQAERDRCLVFHNGEPWSLQEAQPRRFAHGDYVEVLLPPPEKLREPTSVAVWLREQQLSPADIRRFRNAAVGGNPKRPRLHHSSEEQTQQPPELERAVVAEPVDFPVRLLEIARHDELLHALHTAWEQDARTDPANDEAFLHVQTWYVDQIGRPRCYDSRRVRLGRDPSTWIRRIVEAWSDTVDVAVTLHLHPIFPQPDVTGGRPLRDFHLLLLQRPIPGVSSIMITRLDSAEPSVGVVPFVTSSHEIVTKESLIRSGGIEDLCFPQRSDLQCMVWFGDTEIREPMNVLARHGFNFFIILNHIFRSPVPDVWDTDETDLLQKSLTKAVQLIAGNDFEVALPSFVEVPICAENDEVQAELQCWGHECRIFLLRYHDIAYCFDRGWLEANEAFHVLLEHEDVRDFCGVFAHTMNVPLDELSLMCLLHQLGYEKAVVTSCSSVFPTVWHVTF